jgi:hypothetical protein
MEQDSWIYRKEKSAMKRKTTYSLTSSKSLSKSIDLTGRLQQRILDLARKAAKAGITIGEAERQIDDHKAHSISPRFCELVKRGELRRVPDGLDRPTGRFPHGLPRYLSRCDEQTGRSVTIHWLPEFAPLPRRAPSEPDPINSTTPNSEDCDAASTAPADLKKEDK